MKTLLQLNTSLFAAGGQSSQLADKFVATWKANNDGANVIVRDLASNPLPHLDAEHFLAYIAQPADRSTRQQELASAADALIDEIRSADVIVLGLPMYNFGAPSTLKAYFDRIARAGVRKAEALSRDTCAEEDLFFSNRRAFKRGEADYGRLISAIMLD